MAKLILLRHGRSVWNLLGKWTGWTDVDLAPEGYEDAKLAGESIKDVHLDVAYSSPQIRARETLKTALEVTGQTDLEIHETSALTERNYGIYTGKNKWEIKEEVGEELFQQIRRSWDYPIPEGETMKDVYTRVVPFYTDDVLPQLKAGKNIILSASGNSLRSLVKYLEDIPTEEIIGLEVGLGEIYVYEIDEHGKVTHKEIRAEKSNKGKI